MNLTEPQKQIINDESKIKRVIACAGSGKTSTIIYNIADLLDKGKCSPSEVLAITFTKNAAENMRRRIRQISEKKNDFNSINIYTFNSFGNLIISENSFLLGLGKDYRLINIPKSWQIIYRIIKNSDFKKISAGKDVAGFVDSLLHYIRDLKSNLIDVETLGKYCKDWHENLIPKDYRSRALLSDETEIISSLEELILIYDEYEKEKKNNNLIDYHDHIFLPYNLLSRNTKIRDNYIKRFKYIFVDEFQDTDVAQGCLVSLLFNPDYNNMTVVGDDDQSIYSFRGACVENILKFHEWDSFNNNEVKDFYLTENFRSGKKIIDTISIIINKNEKRFYKELSAANNKKYAGVFFNSFKTHEEEAAAIAENIIRLMSKGMKLKDIAIVTRKKKYKTIIEKFEESNIRYELISSRGFFYEKEILFIISWLVVINNLREEQHLLNLIQSDKYKISDRDVFYLKNYDLDNSCFLGSRDAANNNLADAILNHAKNNYLSAESHIRINKFLNDMDFYIKQASFLRLSELINLISEHSGLANELRSDFGRFSRQKVRNIEKLVKISSDFEDRSDEENLESFIIYLRDVARTDEEDPDTAEFSNSNSVKIMSIHAAKGLEFEVVFMPMLRKNDYMARLGPGKFKVPSGLRKDRKIYIEKPQFTSKQKFDEEVRKTVIEEERRIFYVGCSRAKSMLYLSFSEYDSAGEMEKEGPPKEILPFLEDLLNSDNFHICGYETQDLHGQQNKHKTHAEKRTEISISDFYGCINSLSYDAHNFIYRYLNANKSTVSRIKKELVKEIPSVGKRCDNKKSLSHAARKNFSLTELLAFIDCPVSYLGRYVYNIPEPENEDVVIGKEIHEHIKNLTLIGFGKKEIKIPGKSDAAGIEDYLLNLAELNYPQDRIKYLDFYCRSNLFDFKEIAELYTEQLVYWNIDGFIINCKLDRLDLMKNRCCRIIDYKVAESKDGLQENIKSNYINQLKAYICVCSDIYGIKPDKITALLFYLKNNRILENNFTENEIYDFKKILLEAIKRINRYDFSTNKTSICRQGCRFGFLCR